jgi:glycosyltransferase involved in cell wall biosynthesis
MREVSALSRALGARPPIFSLKPRLDELLEEPERQFLETTFYPSLRTLVPAIPEVFGSPRARACVRQVLAAYRTRAGATTKALVTLLLAAAIIPTIRQLHVRHLHAHWATMPALAAYFIKRVIGIPYSITAHAWDIYKETAMLREKLEAADFVVTCTSANLEELQRLGADPARLSLCYHGLDFARLPPPIFGRGGDLRILAIGRLAETKGFADLLKACDLLHRRDIPFRCDIIGAGPLAPMLRALIAAHRLGQVVGLFDWRSHSQILCAYQRYTVLAVPSVIGRDGDRDGIPNVIMEAMSQGLPVVASQVSGIPEVVRPNATGWLVPPGNPPALAAALQETHEASKEARRRAAAAYELVRTRFDVDKNTATLLHRFGTRTFDACRHSD